MTRTCKLCGEPLATDETMARVLVAMYQTLRLAPEQPGDVTIPSLLAFIHTTACPQLASIVAELVGGHLCCRLDEAAAAAGVTVELAPGTEQAFGPVRIAPARRGAQ